MPSCEQKAENQSCWRRIISTQSQVRWCSPDFRSAIALFGKFVGKDISAWETKAKQFAAGLGGNQDIDVMTEGLWPRL